MPTATVAPSVCLKPQALIPRMPGSKRKHISALLDVLGSVPFDSTVVPFGGGL
ncbi:MAG: hypothetical protein AAFY72_06840 [Cyanobacteria bacterium J06649_4]